MICEDCAKPLTVGEVYWYGRDGEGGRCEDCEQAWSARMGRWMRGEAVEPELDRIFAGEQGAIMTPKEEAIQSLKKWQESSDTEAAHAEADEILCWLLRELGHGDVVDEWSKIKKWYS